MERKHSGQHIELVSGFFPEIKQLCIYKFMNQLYHPRQSINFRFLDSYFWGYFVSQIPGARVAESFSAKWVMFFSVTINIVCTLLTPLAAKLHYSAMIAMRIGEGIGGGVTFPAMHVMLAAWAPPTERSTMSALV